MTPGEIGMVFGMLLKYRELHGNPTDRPLRENEAESVRSLVNCSSGDLLELDEFLEAQGFALTTIEAFNLGIPPKSGRDNMVFVLTRRHASTMAPFVNTKWFIEKMRDDRGDSKNAAKKSELTFWIIRMWLTMQWFFYQKDARPTSSLGGYRNALVSEARFIEVLENGVENFLKRGRPDGDAGYMWDVLKDSKSAIPRYARKFLKVMVDGGMIQSAGNVGEYRQTLLAAVEMKENQERELTYLLPANSEEEVAAQTIATLNGYTEEV